MAMDVNTGRVLAMQGGFDSSLSSYNRVTQAQRQPGSTIKPFVYAAALDNGMTPATIIVDGPFSQNRVLLGVLAQLRPRQRVRASALRDGTAAGAAALALIEDGKLPTIGLKMSDVTAAEIEGLAAYQAE